MPDGPRRWTLVHVYVARDQMEICEARHQHLGAYELSRLHQTHMTRVVRQVNILRPLWQDGTGRDGSNTDSQARRERDWLTRRIERLMRLAQISQRIEDANLWRCSFCFFGRCISACADPQLIGDEQDGAAFA